MTPSERWPAVRALLEEAFERPEADRPAFLDRTCADDAALRREVEALLALDQSAPEFLDGPALRPSTPNPVGPEVGREIGPYRLSMRIGEGGMGSVYLAERIDGAFEQQVAVKLLHRELAGGQLARRFESERRLLARLAHAHIARLFDGGTLDDGRPYLVMEHVEGLPLDLFCDEARLSLASRLALFLTVCQAVGAAHQQLIVHRDLKPANILVTRDGSVKLLDFGVAKLLQGDTQLPELEATALAGGQVPYTLGYASPEQLKGEPVTTATDVYSLGVVLFELTTGRKPFDLEGRSLAEVVKTVCEEDPPLASRVVLEVGSGADAAAAGERAQRRGLDPKRLSRSLAGDLDVLLARALNKEPSRRFPSVLQLADDVERHLNGLPIASRPETFSYWVGKLVRRHRLAVSAAAGGVLLLAAFALTMAIQRAEISRQSRQASAERDRAEAVRDLFLGFLEQADPREARGSAVTVRQALERSAARLQTATQLEPMTRASLLDAVGVAYRSLALYREAEPYLEEALRLRRASLGEEHFLYAESLHNLAALRRSQGDRATAELLIRQAIGIERRVFPHGHRNLAQGLNNLASLLREKGQLGEAETLARESLALKERLGGPDTLDVAISLNTLASILAQGADPVEAERLYLRSIELRQKLEGQVSPGLAKTLNNLALLLDRQGRSEEAETLHRRALSLRRKLYPEGHPELSGSLLNLGLLRARRGDPLEASRLLEEGLAFEARPGVPEGQLRSRFEEALKELSAFPQPRS